MMTHSKPSFCMHSPEQLNSMVEKSHHDSVMPLICDQSADSTIFGKEVVACNSGSTFKSTDRPASSPFLNSGVAAASMRAQSQLLGMMGVHSDEKINEPDFSSCLPKGDEFSSDDANCHNLKPCDYQFDRTRSDKFEVHLSETCQRRFVMFDQSGSKKRMIFHPSMVHEFPFLLHSPLTITNSKEPTHVKRSRIVSGQLRDVLGSTLLPPKDAASLDTILPPGWRSSLLPSRDEDTFQGFFSTVAEGSSRERATDCLSKENTEDLDALLWSGDEMSSEGHSPSDLTWSDADSPFSACIDKKRKAGLEAETDSTATSGYSTPNKVLCCNIQQLGRGRGSGYGKAGFTISDLSSADEGSSIGSTNYWRQQKEAHKRPIKKRKDTIHSTLQLLRSIIPGGESMDTAHVLGEAVQYLKNLRGEVERLEGNVFS